MAINELPVELLSKIFLSGSGADLLVLEEMIPFEEAGFSSETISRYQRTTPSAEKQYPILLSHVCQQWRQVAITTPALWCTIKYTLVQHHRWICTWLNRSGKMPLNIFVEDNKNRDIPVDDQMKSLDFLMHLLISNVHRWRSFVLDLAHEKLMLHALHEFLYTAEGAPQLRSLGLSYRITPPEAEYLFDQGTIKGLGPLFMGHTPVLSHVSLSGVHINWGTDTILRRLKWLRLAHHEVDGSFPWDNFVRVLTNSPDLHSFEIENSGPTHNGRHWPKRIISLPKLKRLSFAKLDPQYCGFILERLAAPALTELTLDFDDGDPGKLIRDQLIVSSTNNKNILRNLEIIKIIALECTKDMVSALYQNLGSLVQLHLNLAYLSRDFLLQLVAGGSPLLIARLQTLVLEGIAGRIWTVQNVVKERKAKGFALRRLLISREDEVQYDDLEWFQREVQIFGRC